MTPETASEYIPLIQALAEGKTIQTSAWGGWRDLSDPKFSDPPETYRIKPETKRWSEWQNQYAESLFGSWWRTSREEADATAQHDCIAVLRRDLEQEEGGPVRVVGCEVEPVGSDEEER